MGRGTRRAAVVLVVDLLVLGSAVAGAAQLREDARQAQVALAAAQEQYRDDLLRVLADVEKVVDPLLTADAYTGELGDQIRADVYGYGAVDRDLDHVRASFDRLEPGPAGRDDVHRAVGDALTELRESAVALAVADPAPAAWADPVSRLKAARETIHRTLRDHVLRPVDQLPSAASSTIGATRASAVLHYDSACENAVLYQALPVEPSTPQEAVRQLEEFGTDTFLLAVAVLGVDVPGYDTGHVDTHLRPHAQALTDGIDPLVQELSAAVLDGDLPRAERALASLAELDDVGVQLGRALVDYGAGVCGPTFDVPVPGQVQPGEDAAAT